MPDTYAVAVMTESLDNGAMDLKLRCVEAVSREEAVGMGFDIFQAFGVTIHKVTAIRVLTGDDSSLARYMDEVRAGRKIGAIKMYREDTGVGLRDAKEFIDAMCDKHGIVPDVRGRR